MRSPEDFPADIIAAAMRIAEKANECCYRTDGYEEDIRDEIARALMERDRAATKKERERCAKFLVKEAKEVVASEGMALRAAAAAIRSQP
jgi:hypothetical protein